MTLSGMHYAVGSSRRMVSIRLSPGLDLVKELTRVCEEIGIKAGCIASTVGSLKYATFQSVSKDSVSKEKGPFGKPIRVPGPIELLSASGTITTEGACVYLHIHAVLMDKHMKIIGGHLEPGGNPILNTAEVTLIEIKGIEIRRELDSETGFVQSFPLPLQEFEGPD